MEIEEIYCDLPTLETKRLLIRKLTLDDIEAMYSYASIDEVSKYVTWSAHKTLEETKGIMEMFLSQYEKKQLSPWGIEYKETGKLIGTIDFVSWQTKQGIAEIGYVISPDYWGKGITAEAAQALITFGFEKMELVRVQARCIVENSASARVMEKAGMTYEGTIRKGLFAKGKHHDLMLYSVIDEDFVS